MGQFLSPQDLHPSTGGGQASGTAQPRHGPWQGTSAFLRDATVTSCLVVEAKLWKEERTSVKPSSVRPQPWHQLPWSSSGSPEVFLSFSLTFLISS